MRLFLDANVMTYIAFFEGYLLERTEGQKEESVAGWTALQSSPPTIQLMREIEALSILYHIDDQAHFDWLCSDVALNEVVKIRSQQKRKQHFDLLERLIEHRRDVYEEEGRSSLSEAPETLLSRLFPTLPLGMKNDALQYCEALLVEADYFLTNDQDFIRTVRQAPESIHTLSSDMRPVLIPAVKVSELSFIAELL